MRRLPLYSPSSADMSHRGRVSLLCKNLSGSTSSDDLKRIFSKFGDVRDIYIPKSFYDGRARGE